MDSNGCSERLQPPTTLEKIAGNPLLEAALTAISAAAGTPLAALLPVLGTTTAAGRPRQRVEETLREMDAILARHEAQLRELTDQQYKFINEAVLALLHTTNESKMRFLREVVEGSLSASALLDQEAVFLSRVIRDISAAEVQFLLNNFSCDGVMLTETELLEPKDSRPMIRPNTVDGQAVLGLVTLGLMAAKNTTYGGSPVFGFSPMAAKLIALLRGCGSSSLHE